VEYLLQWLVWKLVVYSPEQPGLSAMITGVRLITFLLLFIGSGYGVWFLITVFKMINKQSATGNRLPASVRRDRACQKTCPIPLPATGAPPDLRGFLPGGYNQLRRLSVPQNDCQTGVTTPVTMILDLIMIVSF
jgi:hypothetical protein